MAEKVVLRTLRFDTNVNHFYRPLHNAMRLLNTKPNIRHDIWKLASCWLDSTLCLEYKPELIAAGSIQIMDKLHDLKIGDVRGLPLWSEKFAPEKWDACIRQMVQILHMRNWPEHAKLMEVPVLPHTDPVPNLAAESETKPEKSGQKLLEVKQGPKDINCTIVTPDSVLAMAEADSKLEDAVPKKDTVVLEPSSLSEDAAEQKEPEIRQEVPCKALDKAYVSRIRDAIRKRKRTIEVCPRVGKVQLDVSSDGMDDWIERELESGVIIESKPVSNNKKSVRKAEVIQLDSSSEDDDRWIATELHGGVIIELKPVGKKKKSCTGERGAALKLEKCNASKLWRGQKGEREVGVDLSSKRRPTDGIVWN